MRTLPLLSVLLAAGPALADEAQQSLATGGLPGGSLTSAALRMVVGLAIVLALLGATAWVSRRFRVGGGLRGGLIEVISGLSLGTRERVVLLRVGADQVLVGVSPSGMRTLHVLRRAQAEQPIQKPSQDFASFMDRAP